MTAVIVAVVAAAVFAWGAVSARLQRADLTAPIVFVAVGAILAAFASLDAETETTTVKLLTEVTLAWVLFSDAARVGIRDLRADAGVFGRLLGLALPLTVVLGWLLAWGLFGGFDVWLALLVGAALAPTDAALGSAVISNPAVPARIRRIINVESGLNDGIVTPVVILALAGTASAEGHGGGGAAGALVELLLGVMVGVVVGGAGGWLLRKARGRGWADAAVAGPAVLALALLAYAASLACNGNGFVAAFAGGIAFGRWAGRAGPQEVLYVEQTAGLASLLVWVVFGLVAVPLVGEHVGWQLLVYAVLSLTAVRMLPVALLLGSGLTRRAALFMGWFGPRGLASVVFALLAVEELGARAEGAVAVITATVLMSVLAHGLTANPWATKYGPTLEGPTTAPSSPSVP